MKIARLSEPFYRRNFRTLVHRCERQTGICATAVDMDSTSAALTMVTSLFCPSQVQCLSQCVEKRSARIDLNLMFRPFTASVMEINPGALVLRSDGAASGTET
jgi:hypothetical protein